MVRTIFAVIAFFAYLLTTWPDLIRAKHFNKVGKIEERDSLIAKNVHSWSRFIVKLAGGTVEVQGEENVPKDTPVVFIGNHQSYLDIPILLGHIQKRKAFIAKIEILSVPILSGWMKLMKCTFLDRKNMRQTVRAMHEAVETLKDGYPLVIFPEGTRSQGNSVGEFKPGSFKLAIKSGVPIIPFTIDGSWHLFEEKKKIQNSLVRITIHPPIKTQGISREEAVLLPEQVRSQIISAL